MAPTLKGSHSHERGWAKLAENLCASRFKRDQSIDTTFNHLNLLGQSLQGAVIFTSLSLL